jgi:long-chain acyl-CoA synthetase
MNYFTLLKEMSHKNKNKLCIRLNHNNYSYENLFSAANRLGDQIRLTQSIMLVYSNNLLFQVTAFFAAMKAGNIPILSHYGLPLETLKKMLNKNQIKYILSDQKLDFDFLIKIETMPEAFLLTTAVEQEQIANAAMCMGALSSGSTDVPKVLFRSYESWTGFFPTQNKIFNIDASTILFMHGSLSFTGNLNAILSVLYAGGSTLLTDVFHCKTWLNEINEFQVTTIYLVPAKLKAFAKFIHEPNKSVTMIFTGSQLLFSSMALILKEKFINTNIILYYGASELNYITYLEYEDLLTNPLSVGKPFPGVTVSIQKGFIYVDTPYHIEGIDLPYTVYDRGYFAENQHLIFLGRQEDVINKGGFKISCIKIEEALKKIPGINNIAVLAYQDNKRGNEVAAFLVADSKVKKGYIRSMIKETLMAVEIPKKFVFLNEIPLNTSGKIDRQKLKTLL